MQRVGENDNIGKYRSIYHRTIPSGMQGLDSFEMADSLHWIEMQRSSCVNRSKGCETTICVKQLDMAKPDLGKKL